MRIISTQLGFKMWPNNYTANSQKHSMAVEVSTWKLMKYIKQCMCQNGDWQQSDSLVWLHSCQFLCVSGEQTTKHCLLRVLVGSLIRLSKQSLQLTIYSLFNHFIHHWRLLTHWSYFVDCVTDFDRLDWLWLVLCNKYYRALNSTQ